MSVKKPNPPDRAKTVVQRRSLYESLIVRIFKRHFKPGLRSFEFDREEIESVASELKVRLPKNYGDLIYSFRYRRAFPTEIAATAGAGREWVIEGAGPSRYRFRLGIGSRIIPNAQLKAIKIPDATPEIISANAMSDEQALLAKVRYNRLVDIFLGVTAYSLQNHLRTTVREVGQIEIDEIYVGVNQHGQQFVIPVQAKGGKDILATTQTRQDIACCEQKFPKLICRAISTQFLEGDTVAMFELEMEDGEVKVVVERHYRLVAAEEIGEADLKSYAKRT
jgi:hypothetical protein